MKVLLVTGLLAEEMIKNYRKNYRDVEVYTLKVPVAAFLTTEYIAQELKKLNLENFDMILVPGMVRGDTSVITNATGVPAFKGPKYAADLPLIMEFLGVEKLSTSIPACELLKENIKRRSLQELERIESRRDVLLKNPGNMLLEDLALGKDFPMRVIAEIVDAPLLSTNEIQTLAKHFVNSGADIIDVGMIASECRPEDSERAVKAVKQVVNVPVSIDTFNPEEAAEGVKAGASLVLSVDAGNMEEMAKAASNAAVVVTPTNQLEGYMPRNVDERVKFLEENIKRVEGLGFRKIIGDLILEPADVLKSFIAYHKFAERNPHVPLLMGLSNVTELMDADSVGVNALLAKVASEIGVSLLLVTEKSNKSKGSVKEVALASKMMFLAKVRGSSPKDLGVDLLILKEKRMREEPYPQKWELAAEIRRSVEDVKRNLVADRGFFRIFVDREEGMIAAAFFPDTHAEKPKIIFKGRTAEEVYNEIIGQKLVRVAEHIAYIAKELTKAEIALKIGRSYVQDEPVF